MSTVLITYSTPPQPPTTSAGPHLPRTADVGDTATPSVAATIAGLDEGIAASISDELTRSGHQVTCRPCVAITTTDGFDLVVAVDRLHVSHSSGTPSVLVHPAEPHRDPARAGEAPRGGESSIPVTWCADWRVVDAWARGIGRQLGQLLGVRTELARVRAELDGCPVMPSGVTSEPRPTETTRAGHPLGREAARDRDRAKRLVRTAAAPEA